MAEAADFSTHRDVNLDLRYRDRETNRKLTGGTDASSAAAGMLAITQKRLPSQNRIKRELEAVSVSPSAPDGIANRAASRSFDEPRASI
jgi:hypothetical protein